MKILFQGDSITDAGRDRNDCHNMGSGYPKYVVEALKTEYPDRDFEFINLSIGGNRTWDLLPRWQTDCIDIQPDIVSVLVGINDSLGKYYSGAITTEDEYYNNYKTLLEDIKKNTHAKIIMLEQFTLSDKTDYCREDLDPKIGLTRKLAREYADVYVPLDGLFAAAFVEHEQSYYAKDGVHPNDEGSKLIAKYYIEAIKKLL